jgi:hypothetical protein
VGNGVTVTVKEAVFIEELHPAVETSVIVALPV